MCVYLWCGINWMSPWVLILSSMLLTLFFILFVTLNGFIKVHERFDPSTHALNALVSSVVSGGLHHTNLEGS